MSAKEQLLLAREHGHELTVEQQGPWPEHGDPHPKLRVLCTCGYRSVWRRSRSSVNGGMAWHLGKVIAELLDETNGRRGA